MKYYGNIELINSKILNLSFERVPSLPDVNMSSDGQVILLDSDNELYFNNGSDYVKLLSSASSNSFRSLLGDNWVNTDFTVNPTPINNLNGISGINGNSTLYDILTKINDRIDNTKDKFEELEDVNITNIQNKDIFYFNGSEFVNGQVSNVISTLNLSFTDLEDVEFDNPNENDYFIYDGAKWVDKKVRFTFEALTPNSIHFVEHNLGSDIVFFTVKNLNTNKNVTPTDVTFTDENNIIFSLPEAIPVKIYIGI